MAHLCGHDCSHLLLGAVDDYVSPDNPVRFIEAFVDELDLARWLRPRLPKGDGSSARLT